MRSKRNDRGTISPSAREKCIQGARKAVQWHEKYGRWFGYGNLAAGLLLMGMGVGYFILLQRFLGGFFQPQAPQNLAWQGFLLGLLFGTLAGGLALIGVHHIHEGVKHLRGDPVERMLVEYHDALLNLARNQDSESPETDTIASNASPKTEKPPHIPPANPQSLIPNPCHAPIPNP
jgi:hypothetical protein